MLTLTRTLIFPMPTPTGVPGAGPDFLRHSVWDTATGPSTRTEATGAPYCGRPLPPHWLGACTLNAGRARKSRLIAGGRAALAGEKSSRPASRRRWAFDKHLLNLV